MYVVVVSYHSQQVRLVPETPEPGLISEYDKFYDLHTAWQICPKTPDALGTMFFSLSSIRLKHWGVLSVRVFGADSP